MKKLFCVLSFSLLFSSSSSFLFASSSSLLEMLQNSDNLYRAALQQVLVEAHEEGTSAQIALQQKDREFKASLQRQNAASKREELKKLLKKKRAAQRRGNFPVLRTLKLPHQSMSGRRVRLNATELENASGGFTLTKGHLALWARKGEPSCGRSWYGRLPSWKGLLWEEYKVQGMTRDFITYLKGEESAQSTYSYQHNQELFSLVFLLCRRLFYF